MRITESRLRRIIRSVLIERQNNNKSNKKRKKKRFSVGDVVLVRHTDAGQRGVARSQGRHAMEWGGCVGVIKRCNPDGTCDIKDPEKELDDLTNLPMKDSYIELIGNSTNKDNELPEMTE